MNTFWDLDRQRPVQVMSGSALAGWFTQRGLLEPGSDLGAADLKRALEVREGLRALLLVNNGADEDRDAIERLNRALRGPGVFVQLCSVGRPGFMTQRRDLDGALALIAMIVAVAQLDGSWSRLKACRGRHCGWIFYDDSRNQSGNWCSMSVCGSRAKARQYRRRKKAQTEKEPDP